MSNKKNETSLKRDFFLLDHKNGKIEIAKIFGNEQPLQIEIGIGRGEFLAGHSLLHWNKNFIGFDAKTQRIESTLKKLEIDKNGNVRLLNLFVDEKLPEMFSENSIERIFINHPDPWPKRKHHKKRLIRQEMIAVFAKLLRKRGVLEISTDHHEYAEWIVDLFSGSDDFISVYENGFSLIPPEGHLITHFEEKKWQDGFPPIFMKFKKI